MKKGKRRIVLSVHFRERWRDTIGRDSDGTIKNRLRSALTNKTIWGTDGAFAVEIDGCKAICTIDPTLEWAFLALLRPGMDLKEGEVG